MATADAIEKIKTEAASILQIKKGPSLVSRSNVWGTIDFKGAEADIATAYSLAEDLTTLPLEFLTDGTSQKIAQQLAPIQPLLKQMDDFNLEGDPRGRRDQLVAQLHGAVDSLLSVAGPQLPYLLYKRGDISTNISRLESAITETKGLYQGAETWIASKKTDIEKVLDAARDVASKSGAAVFGTAFETEADRQDKDADKWLRYTVILAGGTLAVAAAIYAFVVLETEWVPAIQKTTTKLIILGGLGAAALWTGRIYRALRHQAAVNRHRALSIKTLEAFRQAAVANEVKDAVVLEATRAVFGAGVTGYIDGADGSPSSLNIVDMAKSVKGSD